MSNSFGSGIKIQIFGQSHSEKIGVVIDNLPSGMGIDMQKVHDFLARRQGGKTFSTSRKESDLPNIISGVFNGKTCGAPLTAVFDNANTNSKDYDRIAQTFRPSHSDFTAYHKYNGFNDIRGGGQFSGRMTLPLCFAGAIALQILQKQNINIVAHIRSIKDINDESFDTLNLQKSELNPDFPVVDEEKGNKMQEVIAQAKENGDSVGGVIECAIVGLPIGLGEPMFEGVENTISSAVFAIPAVKGIEFGNGFSSTLRFGSENNDCYYMQNDQIKFSSNNSGGILGGISTGEIVVFRVAIKPTPSISKPQKSVNIMTREDDTLTIVGRHDPCIVPRAVPCVEAAAALAVLELIYKNKKFGI